jgi:hypothetical protein
MTGLPLVDSKQRSIGGMEWPVLMMEVWIYSFYEFEEGNFCDGEIGGIYGSYVESEKGDSFVLQSLRGIFEEIGTSSEGNISPCGQCTKSSTETKKGMSSKLGHTDD